ncbi:MAG: RNA-binding protein [Patescibacteria group bacterium]
MAKKLYIGGISYSTSEDALRDAFGQAGSVTSASIIMDKMTGRSRGFGFVEMATDEEAQAAISMWHGKELDGRTLTVNEAKPMAPRGQGGGGFGGGGRGGRGGYGGGRGGNGGGNRW